jgi:6-pyruvoyltetrahydropterin/6-carboxytetrahydropterin synthase
LPITISKTVNIEVAHRFARHPIAQNNRVHGHSLVVTVSAAKDGELSAGMAMDFHAFEDQVKTVTDLLDHRYLNDIRELKEPTLECVAEFIGKRMNAAPLRTVSVSVERPSLGQAAEWRP